MVDRITPEDPQLHLLREGLAFFGKITASVSHELNNVISISDQTTGVVEDMIIGVDQGRPISVDRLEQAVGSLKKQARRGLEIIKRLNTFAHSSDLDRTQFDIGESVANLVELSRRLADLKRATIEMESPARPLLVAGNAFLAQAAIFEPIRLVLAEAQTGDKITVQFAETSGGAEVIVGAPGKTIDPEHFKTPLMQLMLARSGAEATLTTEGEDIHCHFAFTGVS